MVARTKGDSRNEHADINGQHQHDSGRQKMTAITISSAQNNLPQLISEVNDSSEPLTIVNDSGKNAVLLSEDDWNSIQETLYLHSVPGMAESIIKAGQESLSEYTAYNPGEEW